MAQLLNEIVWGEPILPAVSDPAWEAEVKRRVGHVGEIDRRTAANPWVREICASVVCSTSARWSRPRRIPAAIATAPTARS
jgi:hypothetical protein